MNIHTHMSPDRHLLPRSLLPRRPSAQFTFNKGDTVDHLDGGMLGTVVERSRTTGGAEVYWVALLEDNERPLRIMRGPWLVSAGQPKHS